VTEEDKKILQRIILRVIGIRVMDTKYLTDNIFWDDECPEYFRNITNAQFEAFVEEAAKKAGLVKVWAHQDSIL